jgi:C-methyltransferase C-terminal domain
MSNISPRLACGSEPARSQTCRRSGSEPGVCSLELTSRFIRLRKFVGAVRIVILPWNLKGEIVEQLGYAREWGAKFIVPIPEAQIVG